MIGRWAGSLAVLVAAVLVLTGNPGVVGVVLGVVMVGFAFTLSPLFYPRSQGDAAGQQAAARGVPAIYWRPGCSYCLRLRASLGLSGRRAVWVDISRDEDASARVRSVNDGNETVPTIFVGTETATNPNPSWVRELLPT